MKTIVTIHVADDTGTPICRRAVHTVPVYLLTDEMPIEPCEQCFQVAGGKKVVFGVSH